MSGSLPFSSRQWSMSCRRGTGPSVARTVLITRALCTYRLKFGSESDNWPGESVGAGRARNSAVKRLVAVCQDDRRITCHDILPGEPPDVTGAPPAGVPDASSRLSTCQTAR